MSSADHDTSNHNMSITSPASSAAQNAGAASSQHAHMAQSEDGDTQQHQEQ